jgi:hypothetical protein
VRETGLEITNGSAVIAALPREEGEEYDMSELSEYMVALKREYPGTRKTPPCCWSRTSPTTT